MTYEQEGNSEKKSYSAKKKRGRRGDDKKQIEIVEGIQYSSKKEAAKAFGLRNSLVCTRKKAGYTIRQQYGIDPPPIKERLRTNDVEIVIDGVEYSSLESAAKAFNLKAKTVASRKFSGWTVREQYGIDPAPRAIASGCVYRIRQISTGKEYYGLSSQKNPYEDRWIGGHIQQAKVNSISKNPLSLQYAIAKFGVEDFEFAILETVKSGDLAALERKYIKENGSLKPNGFNMNKGTSYALYMVGKAITVENHKFRTIKSACEHYNITFSLVGRRLARGWSVEAAFGIIGPPDRSYTAISKPITVGGITYPSIKNAYEAIKPKIGKETVMWRLRMQWNPDEAFGFQKTEKIR